MEIIMPKSEYKIDVLISDEPACFLTDIKSIVTEYDEENDKDVLLAKCRFFFANIEDSGFSADDLLDVTAHTAPFIELYENESTLFTEDVNKIVGDDVFCSNLFIIDRVEILPEFRGNGLSEILIKDAIQRFSQNSDIIALKAFPLQLEAQSDNRELVEWKKTMKLEQLEQNEIKSKKSLSSFYKKMGFKHITDDLMIMPNFEF